MATDIDLTDLNDCLDQDNDAFDLLAVQFAPNAITLDLCSQAIPQPRRIQITAYTPVQFQIVTPLIAYLDLTNDPERIAPYIDATTTYILIGETVNWSLLLSRLVQQLGHIPYLFNPRYVRETLRHPEYRLPVTVPTSADATFRQIMHEQGVQYYVQHTTARKTAQTILFFGSYDNESFIIAERFTAVELT